MVARSIETVRPQVEARRHSLEVQSAPETLVVDGDATRLDLLRAAGLDAEPVEAEPSLERLGDARTALDELLERFRVIARGVYPAVLRDQGPVAALDEVIARGGAR